MTKEKSRLKFKIVALGTMMLEGHHSHWKGQELKIVLCKPPPHTALLSIRSAAQMQQL